MDRPSVSRPISFFETFSIVLTENLVRDRLLELLQHVALCSAKTLSDELTAADRDLPRREMLFRARRFAAFMVSFALLFPSSLT